MENVWHVKSVGEDVGRYMKDKVKSLLIFCMNDTQSSSDRRMPMLGIAYLQSALEKKGYKCYRIDPFKKGYIYDENEIINFVIKNDIKVVGFSVLECNYDMSLDLAKKIRIIKNDICIMFGGIYATIKHVELINTGIIDVVMRGEGEELICELVEDYELNGKFTKRINCCSYKSLGGEKILCNDIAFLNDLDKNVFPNRDECLLYSSAEFEGKTYYILPISSSRGCPYGCAFCSVPILGTRWRKRSAENVLEEVNQLLKITPNLIISFIDDNFFVDVDRSLKIMEGLYKLNVKFIFATRVNQLILAQQYLHKIKKYGCLSIEVGIENGSNSVLNRFKKNTTVEENLKALKLLKESKINVGIDYITFDCFTTIDELKENIDFMKKAQIWGVHPVFFYNRIIPYEGTYYNVIMKDRKKYFDNDDVANVYNMLDMFASKYQTNIDKCYSILYNKNDKTTEELIDFTYLKIIPYNIFEILVINELTKFTNELINLDVILKKYLNEEEK